RGICGGSCDGSFCERALVDFDAEAGCGGELKVAVADGIGRGVHELRDVEVGDAGGGVQRCGIGDGAAFVPWSDVDVVGFGEGGELAHSGNAVGVHIEAEEVDDTFAEKLLIDAAVGDVAAEGQRDDGFVGDFVKGSDVGDGARLIEPERVEFFERGGQGSGVAGGELRAAFEREVGGGFRGAHYFKSCNCGAHKFAALIAGRWRRNRTKEY